MAQHSSFRQLLESLEAEHRRVVAELREENGALKAKLLESGPQNLTVLRPSSVGETVVELRHAATSSIQAPPSRSVNLQRFDVDIDRSVPGSRASASVDPTRFRPDTRNDKVESQDTSFFYGTSSMLNGVFEVEPMGLEKGPGRSGWAGFADFVTGIHFEAMAALIILLNTLVVALELQYQGLQTGRTVEYRDMANTFTGDSWPGAESVFNTSEFIFLILFSIEITLRIAVLRGRFFRSVFNIFDFLIVLTGVAESVLRQARYSATSVLRLLRIARLLRGLAIGKMSNSLVSLHFLFESVVTSFPTLFWSLCVLCFLQILAGMVLCQLVQGYLLDSSKPVVERHLVYSYYGTTTRAFLAMFEATLGNFAPACRVLVDHVDETYTLYFLFYRCVVGFAVLNVISAVFVQKTLQQAQNDNEASIKKQEQKAMQDRKKLEALFTHLDTSGDGILSWEEFQEALTWEKTLHWLRVLEIDSSDLSQLFRLLDDGDGQICVEEFISSMSRMQGAAKSMDVLQLLKLTKQIEVRLIQAERKATGISSSAARHQPETSRSDASLSV